MSADTDTSQIAASLRAAKYKLGPLGAEPEFSDTSQMVQQAVHRYAVEVMRPVGIKLDRMTPEQAIAPDSPFWDARKKLLDLGFGVEALLSLPPAERAKTMCILFEELGWGDFRPGHLVRRRPAAGFDERRTRQ